MVKRYLYDQVRHRFVEHRHGDLVHYEDYQKLEAELEQLRQQVKAQADDGWIEWSGGECPVPDNTKVQVKFWDGYEPVITEPQGLRWKHFIAHANIIAYRVVKP